MASGEKPAVVSSRLSFSEVVDKACEGLMEQQVKYSIRRIQEMGDCLDGLERELDEFLRQAKIAP
jgi:hypothetical protein